MFTELSPESKLLRGGWNTRVFTNTDARTGNAIQCDFATGSNPEQIYLRVFIQNSKWHAMARIAIRKI